MSGDPTGHLKEFKFSCVGTGTSDSSPVDLRWGLVPKGNDPTYWVSTPPTQRRKENVPPLENRRIPLFRRNFLLEMCNIWKGGPVQSVGITKNFNFKEKREGGEKKGNFWKNNYFIFYSKRREQFFTMNPFLLQTGKMFTHFNRANSNRKLLKSEEFWIYFPFHDLLLIRWKTYSFSFSLNDDKRFLCDLLISSFVIVTRDHLSTPTFPTHPSRTHLCPGSHPEEG